MCGLLYTNLKSIDHDTELYTAIELAAQVAEDASTLCWNEVREWSQACLANIEAGSATWLSRPLFERDRTNLSWVRGRAKGNQKLPCHDHNTARTRRRPTSRSGVGARLECAPIEMTTGAITAGETPISQTKRKISKTTPTDQKTRPPLGSGQSTSQQGPSD